MAFFKQNFIDHVTVVTATWLNGIQEVVGASAVAPEYSDEQIYPVGSLVSHDYQLYTCNTEIPTPEPWTLAHWTQTPLASLLNAKADKANIALSIYPVGSIYMSVNSTSPSSLFGGTWEQLTDTFLYATSTTADTSSTTATDGEATHTLTIDEMPSHTHEQDPHYHKMYGKYDTKSAAVKKVDADYIPPFSAGEIGSLSIFD